VAKPIGAFRFGNVNLALGSFALCEPAPPPQFKCGSHRFTPWDSCLIEGDLTVRELLQSVKAKLGVTVEQLSLGNWALYQSFTAKTHGRLDRKIQELLVGEFGQPRLTQDQWVLRLTVACVDDKDEAVETPTLALKVK
jgi:ubiquitin-activating enzyme E1